MFLCTRFDRLEVNKYLLQIYMLQKKLFHWLKRVLHNTNEHGQKAREYFFKMHFLVIKYFPPFYCVNYIRIFHELACSIELLSTWKVGRALNR